MQLLFKFGQTLVFLSISCDYDLFHVFDRLIFHDIFVFFTTSYIHLIAHTTKVVRLQLHKVCVLPSNYTYRLFNSTYICICVPIKFLPTYLLGTYIPTSYLIGYLIINNYLKAKQVPNKNLCYLIGRICNSMCQGIVATRLQLKFYPILFVFLFKFTNYVSRLG